MITYHLSLLCYIVFFVLFRSYHISRTTPLAISASWQTPADHTQYQSAAYKSSDNLYPSTPFPFAFVPFPHSFLSVWSHLIFFWSTKNGINIAHSIDGYLAARFWPVLNQGICSEFLRIEHFQGTTDFSSKTKKKTFEKNGKFKILFCTDWMRAHTELFRTVHLSIVSLSPLRFAAMV